MRVGTRQALRIGEGVEAREVQFERLFRANYEALCRFAYRFLRDRAAAEDIVQDVFEHLWIEGNNLIVRTSVRAYLYAAVRNRSLNLCKHASVVAAWEREVESDADAVHVRTLMPDETLDLAASVARLSAAFDKLPPRQAEAMRLRWHEELSHAEIAEALGISVKGVEKHLSRALATLRQELGGPS
jgi:RNA polymerase sigma-19 factor, ECF subfamily